MKQLLLVFVCLFLFSIETAGQTPHPPFAQQSNGCEEDARCRITQPSQGLIQRPIRKDAQSPYVFEPQWQNNGRRKKSPVQIVPAEPRRYQAPNQPLLRRKRGGLTVNFSDDTNLIFGGARSRAREIGPRSDKHYLQVEGTLNFLPPWQWKK